MELTIFCPQCSNLYEDLNDCCHNESCDYNINDNNQYFLYNHTLNSYHIILNLLKEKKVYDAWLNLKENIFYFPFIKECNELGFYLSIMFGDYSFSQRCLSSLKNNIDDKQYNGLKDLLVDNLKINNNIISNMYLNKDDIYNDQLTVSHLYLLFLKANDEDKKDIVKLIYKIDPSLGNRLSLGIKESILSQVIKLIATIGIIFAILSMIYMSWKWEYDDGGEIIYKKTNLILFNDWSLNE